MEETPEERAGDGFNRTQQGAVERRSSKVTKKGKEKKQLSEVNIAAVLEAAENRSPDSDDTQDGKERKPSGIVIDGKTYTCVACKAGHRVGICKHARERPMTATHPPGRPPAGAPKKIICNCPKQCNCRKRDCKCARKCSCTQVMYMLVYIPAPGKSEDTDEEGTWRKGQQVITDLKGNILTPEQVKERREQKEIQKSLGIEHKFANSFSKHAAESTKPALPEHEAKPEESGGCCTHKEKVAAKNIVAETSLPSRRTENATTGCNCGGTCTCAFCPEHPNNSTSTNMARQQAVHFANQPYNNDQQSIVSFTPTMPQGASCMGGLPRFAVSRYSQRPSYEDLQTTFPNPGYVITYPIWSTRTDDTGLPMAPFPVQSPFTTGVDLMNNEVFNGLQTPLHTPHAEVQPSDFSQDEFGIGNAFVTSAGPGDWGQNFLSSNMWPLDNSTPMNNNFMNAPDYLNQSPLQQNAPVPPMEGDANFSYANFSHVGSQLFDMNTPTPMPPVLPVSSDQQLPPQDSCCGDSQASNSVTQQIYTPGPYYPREKEEELLPPAHPHDKR